MNNTSVITIDQKYSCVFSIEDVERLNERVTQNEHDKKFLAHLVRVMTTNTPEPFGCGWTLPVVSIGGAQ